MYVANAVQSACICALKRVGYAMCARFNPYLRYSGVHPTLFKRTDKVLKLSWLCGVLGELTSFRRDNQYNTASIIRVLSQSALHVDLISSFGKGNGAFVHKSAGTRRRS